jgi:hypothetical protein
MSAEDIRKDAYASLQRSAAVAFQKPEAVSDAQVRLMVEMAMSHVWLACTANVPMERAKLVQTASAIMQRLERMEPEKP